MSITIRDYQSADFEHCCSLWGELTQHHADIYEDPTITVEAPGWGFGEYLRNPARRSTWVAELNGRVVALTGLLVNGEEGEIEPVVVS